MLHLVQVPFLIKHPINSTRIALSWVSHHGGSLVLVLLLLSHANALPRRNTQDVRMRLVTSGVTTAQDNLLRLKPGTPVEREIRGDEIHTYEVSLIKGQFARFVIEVQGVDVTVTLVGPDGQKVAPTETKRENKEREELSLLVRVAGSYKLKVRASGKAAVSGRYTLSIAELRTGTDREILTLKAEDLMREAGELETKRLGSAPIPIGGELSKPARYLELSHKTIEKYEEALDLWRRVTDRQQVAHTLYLIGQGYFVLGDLSKALNCYDESLRIWNASDDKAKQLLLVNAIGEVQTNLGEYEKALDSFNQGRQLAQDLKPSDKANALTNIGDVFFHLGQFQKSLDYYKQALPLWQEAQDNWGEVRARYKISLVKSSQPLPFDTSISGKLDLVLTTGHLGIVEAVTVSADGRFIATGGMDRTVRLWDLADGHELRTLTNHLNTVTAIRFSPDGTIVASGSHDGTIKLIETRTGKHLRTLTSFSEAVSALAFSPDGRLLAAGGFNNTLKLWDVSTGRELHTFVGHQYPITAIAYSPDGKMLASGGGDATVRVWDIASGRELQTLIGHLSIVKSVVFTSDSKSVVSGGMNSELKLWDINKGRMMRDFVGHPSQINSIAMSPDGRLLVSAGGSGAIDDTEMGLRVWDIETGRQVRHLADKEHLFQAVTFTEDGRSVVATGGSSTIKSWDVLTWEPRPSASISHVTELSGVAFSADGTLLASRSEDGIRLWDTLRRDVRTLSTARSYGSLALSPNGRLVAGEDNHGISIWDTATERVLHTFDAFLPKDSYSLPETGAVIGGLQSLAFSKDGRLLALASNRRKPILLDVATGEEPKSWANGSGVATSGTDEKHKFSLYAVALSPDGRFVAAGGAESEYVEERHAFGLTHSLSIWEISTGTEASVRTPAGVNALSFSPDSKQLAVGSEDHTIRIFEMREGRELNVLRGHSGGVNFLTFSPDGRWLAAAAGSEVKLWTLALGVTGVYKGTRIRLPL
jgi:WD40 repeat protein